MSVFYLLCKKLTISPSKCQQMGCSSSFDLTCKIRGGTKLSCLVTLCISKQLSIKTGFSFSTDPPIIMRKLSVQASRGPPTAPFTPRDAERPGAGQHRGIYPMTVEFRGNEKNCPMQSH